MPEMQNEFGMGWSGSHTTLENGSWGPRFDGSMQLYGNVYNNSQKIKPYVAVEDNMKTSSIQVSDTIIVYLSTELQIKVPTLYHSHKSVMMVLFLQMQTHIISILSQEEVVIKLVI